LAAGTSFGGSLFEPPIINGCQLWLDGADIAGTGTQIPTGVEVLSWIDKSGVGNYAEGVPGTSGTSNGSGGGVTFSLTSAGCIFQDRTIPYNNSSYTFAFVASYAAVTGTYQYLLKGGFFASAQLNWVYFDGNRFQTDWYDRASATTIIFQLIHATS
jgi:hypothetical protein